MLFIIIILAVLIGCAMVLAIVLLMRSRNHTHTTRTVYSDQSEKNISVTHAGADVGSGQLGSGSLFNGYALHQKDTVCISGNLASGRLPHGSAKLILVDVSSGQNFEKEFYKGIVIGRQPYAAVSDGETGMVITGTGISSVHCCIFMDGTNCYVEDKNSTNGTFLNGQRIYSPQIIKTGDRLKIGQREFYVNV